MRPWAGTTRTAPSSRRTARGLSSGVGLSAQPQINWRRTANGSDRYYHSITEFESLPDPSVCDTPDKPGQGTRCPVSAYSTGGPNTISVSSLNRYQGKVLGTYLLNALGHHILKAGVDAEGASFYNHRARTGLAPWYECTDGTCFYTLNQYGSLDAPDRPVFLASKEGTSTSLTVGGFVQDSWSILDKVTLNAGVRYDTQTIWGTDGQVGLNLPRQWSPRVGLVYDFTQKGRSKLYANFARFYENVPLDLADLSFPPAALAVVYLQRASVQSLASWRPPHRRCLHRGLQPPDHRQPREPQSVLDRRGRGPRVRGSEHPRPVE